MKLVRLFLMSGLAFVAFSGVAAAAEVPPPLSAPPGVNVVSTTVTPEGTWTTYSNEMRLFEPATPFSIGECGEQWFCLWENINFAGRELQWHDSGKWQGIVAGYGASSFYNHRNNSSRVSGAPGVRCFPPGGAGNFSSEWNDKPREVFLDQAVFC
jgi:peptidase inhibitor family I36